MYLCPLDEARALDSEIHCLPDFGMVLRVVKRHCPESCLYSYYRVSQNFPGNLSHALEKNDNQNKYLKDTGG